MPTPTTPIDAPAPTATAVITPDQLLAHWQGHRRLTRRMIEAFPDDQLFSYSVGGMRPFGALALECIGMAASTVTGVATGQWTFSQPEAVTSKDALLARWDAATAEVDELWPTIPAHRFQEVDMAFGQWEGPGYWILFYVIDNEIHHRGQGYAYLRALGIEPPPFYER